MEQTAYLGLGSNLGDRLESIRRAIHALGDTPGIGINPKTDVAGIYETSPVDASPGSPPFLNTVVRVHTSLDPVSLLRVCLNIEESLGRTRSTPSGLPPCQGGIEGGPHRIAEMRIPLSDNTPRPIDIDILLFDDLILNQPNLIIPHPRLHLRRFVLEPLCELAPDVIHPVLGTSIRDRIYISRKRFPDQHVNAEISPCASPVPRR